MLGGKSTGGASGSFDIKEGHFGSVRGKGGLVDVTVEIGEAARRDAVET